MLSSCPSETPVFPGPRKSLPQLRGEKAGSSGPPGAGGRQRPMLGTRGRPCPAEPTRARPAAAGFPEPSQGGAQPGAAPRPCPEPRPGSPPAPSRWLSPFPELGLPPKAAIRTSEARRRGVFRERGCVRPRHKGLFSTPALPSRSLPAGFPEGEPPGRDRQCWMVGVAAPSGPRGHGGRAQD